MTTTNPLDRKDRLMLNELQEHGRISNVELAGRVALAQRDRRRHVGSGGCDVTHGRANLPPTPPPPGYPLGPGTAP